MFRLWTWLPRASHPHHCWGYNADPQQGWGWDPTPRKMRIRCGSALYRLLPPNPKKDADKMRIRIISFIAPTRFLLLKFLFFSLPPRFRRYVPTIPAKGENANPTQPNPAQPNPTQPNPTQPNPTQPKPTQSNQTQPNGTDRLI